MTIKQSGIYLIKVYSLEHHNGLSESGVDSEMELMVGSDVHGVSNGECALRIEKGREVRVIVKEDGEVLLCIQRI